MMQESFFGGRPDKHDDESNDCLIRHSFEWVNWQIPDFSNPMMPKNVLQMMEFEFSHIT